MKLIEDDGPHSAAHEAVNETMFAPIHDRDVVVVFLERKTANCSRQSIRGLDDVLIHAPSGIPVIMLGWLYPRMPKYADDPRWHAALGYPNVVFRQLPEGLEDLVGAFKEASDRNRKPDPLAIALLTIKIAQSEVQVLHHDLHYAEQDPETMPAWLKRAQRHFADKPEADLVEAVKQAHRECKTAGKFSGEIFPDTCVDVEGTLFDSNGVFRPDVLARAVTEANGQPITIWTGGDLVAVRKMLRDARVPYKLVPKELMAGATVGNVIDDMPEAEFRETYGIHYGHYTQIAP